jgi:hypothetical protein
MATRTERSTVVGVFHEPEDARKAIEALKDAGFRSDDIGLLMQDRGRARDLADETGTKAGEGAATGALAGGVLGGLAGWLVGIGALAIPGFGPFIAAGALGTALTGAAIGAGVGAVAGALIGMGIPEEEAHWYENEVKGGRTLVTVRADGRYDEAQALLRRHGAYDVETGAMTMGTTGSSMAGTAQPTTGRQRRAQTTPRASRGASMPSSTGGMSGSGFQTWEDYSPSYRQQWEGRYGSSGRRWEDVEPFYHYGYVMAQDARFQDREFGDAEPTLRSDYQDWARRNNYRQDASAWDEFKMNVREAWDSARARVHR